MRILQISLFLCLVYLANCSNANVNYKSDDTAVVEAIDDEAVVETTTAADEITTGRQSRQEESDGSCNTKSGLPGACENVMSCFPRLFPIDPDNAGDTPKNSHGLYNQNLLANLIETYGLCDDSKSKRSEVIGEERFSDTQEPKKVCCPHTKSVEGNYSLSDPSETPATHPTHLRKPCGYIKVEPNSLPVVEFNDTRIVNGYKAVLGEYPWAAALLKRGQQFCGGSLIDERNVLTAAHCVEFMNQNDVQQLRLHLGDLDLQSTADTEHVVRRAKRVLYHKGFSMKNLAHDIALIHLDKPVTFSKTIQPVCLHPGSPPYDTGNEEAAVAGWGTTSSGGSQSTHLLAVRIRVMPNEECNMKYAKANKKITPGMVCAGSPGKDSCQGDSGGPLVVGSRHQASQIGIVSWGIGCASYPGVYTRVDKYSRWINKNKQQ